MKVDRLDKNTDSSQTGAEHQKVIYNKTNDILIQTKDQTIIQDKQRRADISNKVPEHR